MPQLMPLMWEVSIFMFLFFVMMLFNLYHYMYKYNLMMIDSNYFMIGEYKW